MFVEERGEVDAQVKIGEVFKEIQEVILGSLQNCQLRAHGNSNKNFNINRSYFSNDYEQHGQLKKKVHSEVRPGHVSNNQSSTNIINPGENQSPQMLLKRASWSHLSNDLFIKFKVFEMMQYKNGGSIEINKSLTALGDVIEALVWTQRDDQIHVAGGRPGVKRPTTLGSSNRLEPSFMLRDVSTWAQKK